MESEEAKFYYDRAIDKEENNDYEGALEDYNKAIELDPDYTYAYNNRAGVYFFLGKLDLAIANYNKAIELDPNHANANFNRAVVYVKLKEHAKAFADYERALEIDPNNIRVHVNKAVLHNSRSEFEQAIISCDTALKIDADNEKAWLQRALACYNLRRDEEALQAYNKTLELNPNKLFAYRELGFLHMRFKNYAEAISNFTTFLNSQPTSDVTPVYEFRAYAYLKQRQYKEAVEDYDKYLEKRPELSNDYTKRAQAHIYLKNVEKAEADFLTAWELNKNETTLWSAYWARFGREAFSLENIAKFEEVIATTSSKYQALLSRALVTAFNNMPANLDKGLAEIDAAISDSPSISEAYFWKGLLLAYKNLYVTGMGLIEEALQRNLPPGFLLPLQWTAETLPDFWQDYAKPLLEKYELL